MECGRTVPSWTAGKGNSNRCQKNAPGFLNRAEKVATLGILSPDQAEQLDAIIKQ